MRLRVVAFVVELIEKLLKACLRPEYALRLCLLAPVDIHCESVRFPLLDQLLNVSHFFLPHVRLILQQLKTLVQLIACFLT